VSVPGSKSLTARALIAAAMAEGTSTITGALRSDDTERMVDSLHRLGVEIAEAGDRPGRPVAVHGANHRIVRHPTELDVGLAGTAARFLTPIAATGAHRVVVDGTERMRQRPMADLCGALRQLGATVESLGQADHLPLQITGPLTGGAVAIPGDTSSQFLSGLLLAAPAMPGGLQITLTTPLVSRPYVEMTVAVMAAFGVTVTSSGTRPATHDPGSPAHPPTPGDRWTTETAQTRHQQFTVAAGQQYKAADFQVEPDASAASYIFAAAALTGSRLTVNGVHRRSAQGDTAFVNVLAAMGATVTEEDAGLTVAGTRHLTGTSVDMADFSDVAQSLAVVAPYADSPTTITGIGFIRGKESDRIGATVNELRRCGVDAEELPDGLTVRPGAAHGTTVDTHGDHRMAMSFAVLGLRAPGMAVADPGVVAKTFPAFFDVLDSLHTMERRTGS